MKRIKELDRKLRNAIALEDMAYEAAFEGDETTEAQEKEWEQLADIVQALREELAAEIVKATFGQIDSKTAWAMTFKPELHEIIKRIA